MNTNIQNLKTYLQQHPLNYEASNIDSLLESLYWHYSENNPSFNNKIRDLYKQVHDHLAHLTTKEEGEVFRLFSDISSQQEQLAFIGGLRMGIQLVLELLEQ